MHARILARQGGIGQPPGNPKRLAGVGPGSRVANASLAVSTIGDDQVEQCVLAAARGIAFLPLDGGGVVIVSYPLIFRPSTPGGGASP